VLGLAFLFAGRASLYLLFAMSLLMLAVGWAYTQICRIFPDGGGVYTAAKKTSRTLAVIGALLLFADYTVTASLSVLDGFHYFGLPMTKHVEVAEAKKATTQPGQVMVQDAGDRIQVEDSDMTTVLPTLPQGVAQVPAFKKLLKYKTDQHELIFTGKRYFVFSRPMTEQERDTLLKLSPAPPYQQSVQALYTQTQPTPGESLWAWDSPGLWAIIAIAVIGLFNLMGPKHTGRFAIGAAMGMVFITLLIVAAALLSGKVHWSNIHMGSLRQNPADMWVAFVSIMLALSGVESIANLTGVMKKPISQTAGRAIWVVACEVAFFNVVLGLFMMAIYPMDRSQHVNDMLAFLTSYYVGPWGEWPVRIIGGLLLLSAGNTAINAMASIIYVVSRDGELPAVFQIINRFGAPWVATVLAVGVPIILLFISHSIESLAALYAIGVIGAISINITLCSMHPRLRKWWRKVPMFLLGLLVIAILITLAVTKLHALVFVLIVIIIGLSARAATRWLQSRHPKPSLLRQAIIEQLTPAALAKPKLLIGTYGSETMAPAAIAEAKEENASLVVCFIRQVALSYKHESEQRLSLDTDLAAQKTFSHFLELGHKMKVPIIPVYDTGPNAAELLAEAAAIHGVQHILIGTSRQGALYHLIKGSFQRHLEALLPPEIPVQVISAPPAGMEQTLRS
jgi:amino acid transporter